MMYKPALLPQPAWGDGDRVKSNLSSLFNCSKEQNSPTLLLYSNFSSRSIKVTKISYHVPKIITSLAPYLVTKYFPPLLLFQPCRDFPRRCQPGASYLKFSRALGGG
ncbi:hypothetical protein N341_04877, partial [Tyto alba]